MLNNEKDEEVELKKYIKEKRRLIIQIIILTICIVVLTFFLISIYYRNRSMQDMALKPIIYIYTEEKMQISVKLGKPEKLTSTYPKYTDEWKVIANPDGTLEDLATGREYYSLYWEGLEYNAGKNMQEGFIVKNEDIVQFLEEKLEILGLNDIEAQEFIIYWLPKLEQHNYVYIRFKTMEEINEEMPLIFSENPDTLIRVMMEWKGMDKYKEIKEQKLEKTERKGFTIVEWGGVEIK